MGAYYFYGNRTKQEWFFVDPASFDIKQYGIGRGVGARCFSLLLLEHDPPNSTLEEHERIGSWIGDEVFIAADDSTPDFDSVVRSQWSDIAEEMLDMLAEVDPYAFLDHGGESWLLNFAGSGDMSESVRRKLLTTFRRSKSRTKTDGYDALIDSLRPRD